MYNNWDLPVRRLLSGVFLLSSFHTAGAIAMLLAHSMSQLHCRRACTSTGTWSKVHWLFSNKSSGGPSAVVGFSTTSERFGEQA